MEKKPFDHAFTFKDDLSVRESYADGVGLITFDGSVAKILFTIARPDDPKPGHKGPPKGQKVPAARMVLSANAFATLFNQMNQLMHGLEQAGVVKREGGEVKATVQ